MILIENINVQYLGRDDGKEVINDIKGVLQVTLLPAGAGAGGGRGPGRDGPRTPAAAPCSLQPLAVITRVNTVFTYCGHYGGHTCQ